MHECERIISTIEHFYGHLHIKACGKLGLCSVEFKEDVEKHKYELDEFCKLIYA